MQHRKMQVAPGRHDRPPLLEAAPGQLRKGSRCQNFVADLTSIVSAARKLPAEVDPPARVWTSLRTQLEKEGMLSCSVGGAGKKQARHAPQRLRVELTFFAPDEDGVTGISLWDKASNAEATTS